MKKIMIVLAFVLGFVTCFVGIATIIAISIAKSAQNVAPVTGTCSLRITGYGESVYVNIYGESVDESVCTMLHSQMISKLPADFLMSVDKNPLLAPVICSRNFGMWKANIVSTDAEMGASFCNGFLAK